MKRLVKFNTYNEGLKSMAHSMKRKLTGKSAGEEIEKLSTKQQEKLAELYAQDPDNPMEAARYLRSIIIKEKNSQFGIGLALTIAGAAMIYKAYQMENIEEEPKPDDDDIVPEPVDIETYKVKAGDSWWAISEKTAPNLSGADRINHTLQLAKLNGHKCWWSGENGSPGVPSGWYDTQAAFKGELVKVPSSMGEQYILRPGQVVKIIPFNKTIPMPNVYGK